MPHARFAFSTRLIVFFFVAPYSIYLNGAIRDIYRVPKQVGLNDIDVFKDPEADKSFPIVGECLVMSRERIKPFCCVLRNKISAGSNCIFVARNYLADPKVGS